MVPSITRRVGLGLTLAVLSACAVGYLASRTTQLLLTSGAEVEHTHTVLEAIAGLSIDIGRSRTAARSYGIVGDSTMAEPYRSARASVAALQGQLRTLVTDHPEQQALLDSAAAPLGVLLAAWDALVAGPPGNPAAMAVSYRRSPLHRPEQERLDSLLGRMQRTERAMLASRARANDEYVGQTRWILAGAVALTMLILLGTFLLFLRHLHERDRAELERGGLQNFLDSIIEHIPLMVFVKDAENLRFVRFNRTGEDLLGCSRDSLIGQSDFDLFPREQAEFFTAKDRETLAGNRKVVIEEEPLETRTQGTRMLRTHKMAIRSVDGRPEYLLGISEDITERLGAEEQIRAAHRELMERTSALEVANRDLEAFSYTVSHDLRAPVRAVEGFTRILVEEHAASLDVEGRRLLEVVRSNARRMGQMVDDLLRLARVGRQELRREAIDMGTVVREQLADLAQGDPDRKVEVVVEQLPAVDGDPGLVRQVTANLLDNAWKFTRHRKHARVRIGGARSGTMVEYVISDNGAGFDMKYADKLFGVFQRLHRAEEYEGTGVGLAVVHRIVERHGGRVWAESEPGEGATFHFTLPKTGEVA